MPIARARGKSSPQINAFSCERRSPGFTERHACGPRFLLAQEHKKSAKTRERYKRKWGPALLPTPCRRTSTRSSISEETNRAVWFRRPAPPRAASGAKALRFGHRGRARYSCEPQRHGLDGQLGVPDRSPFRFASATTCRTAFRPVRASRTRPSRPTPFLDRGDVEGRFGLWLLLPLRRRLRVRTSRPSATWQTCLESAPNLAILVSSSA